MLISISGLAGSGKNHIVDVLSENLLKSTCVYFAFADYLKELCMIITNTYTQSELWYEAALKDVPREELSIQNCNDREFKVWCVLKGYNFCESKSPRFWLQEYSDFIKYQHKNPDIFVDRVVDELKDYDLDRHSAIVTDTRYPAELEALKKLGAITVYVENSDLELSKKHKHSSEQLRKEDCEYVVYNSYTTSVDDLIGQWKEILKC